jgi:hypothetical protein
MRQSIHQCLSAPPAQLLRGHELAAVNDTQNAEYSLESDCGHAELTVKNARLNRAGFLLS